MFRQLVLFRKTNNASVKAKEFWSLLGVFAIIHHDVLLYIRRFCQ
jgi:hypothetical protein